MSSADDSWSPSASREAMRAARSPAWFIFRRSRLRSVGGRRRAAPIGGGRAGGAGLLGGADIRLAGAELLQQQQQRSDEEDSEPTDWAGVPHTRRQLVTKITTDETSAWRSEIIEFCRSAVDCLYDLYIGLPLFTVNGKRSNSWILSSFFSRCADYSGAPLAQSFCFHQAGGNQEEAHNSMEAIENTMVIVTELVEN